MTVSSTNVDPMSLYRRYRPQTLNDIIGQDHIKQTLRNALAHNMVGHGYLFSGPRGVGKTTIARIIAMAVNCSASQHSATLPCGECVSCQNIKQGSDLNIVEVDAASNRGINEIRALRDSVAVGSTRGVYKVFIIDEVHMLTKEAFNALLKTLEEPPKQVIFILATTELHKVPETIISRVQHFEFKRATTPELVTLLQLVSQQEKIAIEEAALTMIAEHADGGFRDALSLLEQLVALGSKKITENQVRFILGIASEQELCSLLIAAFNGESQRIKEFLDECQTKGYDTTVVIDGLIGLLQKVLWQINGLPSIGSEILTTFLATVTKNQTLDDIMALIERLLIAKMQIRWSPLPRVPLELALLARLKNTVTSSPTELISIKTAEVTSPVPFKTSLPSLPKNKQHTHPQQLSSDAGRHKVSQPLPATDTNKNFLTKENFEKIINAIREKNAALAALLKSSEFGRVEDKQWTIAVPFSFYANRILDDKNAQLIQEIVKTQTGLPVVLRCEVVEKLVSNKHTIPSDNPTAQPDVITEVFKEYIA